MDIAAYCRVSTDRSDQLNSLEAQKKFFAAFTEKNGHRLVRLYADEGISGTGIRKRTEFRRLLRDAEQGLFEMVVVKDISRFARNTVDFLQSIRALKSLGIETVFLTANMSVLGNSEFVLTIFGALAQEESANTSKRIKFGKQLNAERGRVPNLVFGYDKTAGDYFHLAVNEREAATVRQIFDWYVLGGYGAPTIAGMLNERGIRTKRGCSWSQNAVSRILTNELYIGRIVNGKQEVADFLTGARVRKEASDWHVTERPELAIVSPERFEAAQSILSERREALRAGHERQSNKYLFSTLIRCGECGYSFRRTERRYKNTYVRWVCSGRNGRGADFCPNTTGVEEAALIAALEAHFADMLRDRGELVRSAVGAFIRRYRDGDENAAAGRELRERIRKLRRVREKYLEMYADGLLSREELDGRLGGIGEELAGLESELALARRASEQGERLEQLIAGAFQSVGDIVSLRDMTNAQLKQLIRRIEADRDGNVDIYLRAPAEPCETGPVRIRSDRT